MAHSRRTKKQKNGNKSGKKGGKNRGKNRPIKNEAFSMENSTSFPMKKLCYDLVLEVLEQMDTDDVIELVKINQGFQGMLVKDPSFIFGQHVHEMNFSHDEDLACGYSRSRYLKIRKFSTSTGFRFDTDDFLHELLAKLRTKSVKRIDPCKKFAPQDPHQTFLRQLKWVDELEFRGRKWDWKEFFADFHAAVKSSAELFLWGNEFEGEESMNEQLGHFIKTQLNECEKVSLFLDSRDLFHFCYDALSKTRIKLVQIFRNSNSLWIRPLQMDFQLNVEWIVKSGIPSQNPHAGFSDHCSVSEIPAETVAFLKGYPGMELIDGKDCLPLFKQAKKLWRKDFDIEARFSFFNRIYPRRQSLCFRRRIDSTKSGVYILRGPDNWFGFQSVTSERVFDYVSFYAFHVSA